MRHVREGPWDLDSEALAPDGGEGLLHEQEQRVSIGEGRLHVELGDLLDAIGAKILVPEADRNLVVAVESGDHQQLLEQLRALRKREERALVEPARDDEVPGTLGGRLVEQGCLNVEVAGRFHLPADDPHHLPSEADGALELLAPEIQPAIAKSEGLVDVLLVELEGERGRARHDPERRDLDLDGSGREVGIDRVGGAGRDLALRLEDELVADLLCELRGLRSVLRVDHELCDAAAVAQVDENEATVIASASDPSGKGGARSNVLLAKLAAHLVSPAHADSLPTTSAWVIGSSECPCRRRRRSVAAHDDRGGGAEACRLGQLALQRPSRKVRVGRDAEPPELRQPPSDLLPRCSLLEREEHRDRRDVTRRTRIFHGDHEPLETRAESDAGCRRTADLLDEAVVAPAARDRRVLVLHRADELPRRPRVVVETPDERRDERVGDARCIEIGSHPGEHLHTLRAERLADLRCLIEGEACRLRLREVVVEDAEGARRDLRACLLVESVLVGREPLTKHLEVGGAARAAPDRVQFEVIRRDSQAVQQGVVELDQLGVDRGVVRSDRLHGGLPVLPEAALAGCAVAIHRRNREQLQRLGIAVHSMLDVGAANWRCALGTKRERPVGSIREAVHLLLHDVRSLARRPCEEGGVLEDRREDLAIAVERTETLDLGCYSLPERHL